MGDCTHSHRICRIRAFMVCPMLFAARFNCACKVAGIRKVDAMIRNGITSIVDSLDSLVLYQVDSLMSI